MLDQRGQLLGTAVGFARLFPALVWPSPVGTSHLAGFVRPPLYERRRSAM